MFLLRDSSQCLQGKIKAILKVRKLDGDIVPFCVLTLAVTWNNALECSTYQWNTSICKPSIKATSEVSCSPNFCYAQVDMLGYTFMLYIPVLFLFSPSITLGNNSSFPVYTDTRYAFPVATQWLTAYIHTQGFQHTEL